jgi:hypothetical protein
MECQRVSCEHQIIVPLASLFSTAVISLFIVDVNMLTHVNKFFDTVVQDVDAYMQSSSPTTTSSERKLGVRFAFALFVLMFALLLRLLTVTFVSPLRLLVLGPSLAVCFFLLRTVRGRSSTRWTLNHCQWILSLLCIWNVLGALVVICKSEKTAAEKKQIFSVNLRRPSRVLQFDRCRTPSTTYVD